MLLPSSESAGTDRICANIYNAHNGKVEVKRFCLSMLSMYDKYRNLVHGPYIDLRVHVCISHRFVLFTGQVIGKKMENNNV